MKVIEPLFLNELYEDFEKNKGNAKKLRQLIYRLSKLKIFDPACGSGNFLIIGYKELRKLEIQILQEIYSLESQHSIVFTEIKLSQFYGIELDDFAHEMAILSLWLAEHQMNKEFVDELHDFGKAKPILPLKEAGNIAQGNATRLNWEDTCPKNSTDEIYILGNPPYLGYGKQNAEQKEDLRIVFTNIKNYKKLDYISCWFIKASDYIRNCNSAFAFVTTNSITQGEQVSLLWPNILNKGLEICFAHQSFKWTNNAKGNAGVSVVIIGIRTISNYVKYIYDSGLSKKAYNINPYLTQGENIIVNKRNIPLSSFPIMMKGSQPTDGGNLLLTKEEKVKLELNNPSLKGIIKRYYGAKEYIRDDERFCLWIEETDLKTVTKIEAINKRLDAVQSMRESSTKNATNQLAEYPHMFGEIRYFKKEAIIIPTITSERRDYIPCGFIDADSIISNTAQAIYDFPIYMFGIISSAIMLTWIKAVGGKFKTDYIVSSSICYNTFPFPEINQKQKEQINLHVFEVLEEREKHSSKTMAQLYDPIKMPKGLKEAHHQLDLAIERCYRLKPFESDTERLEYLFKEYEKMIHKNTLLEKPKRTRKTKKA
jgi:hypothetical protein